MIVNKSIKRVNVGSSSVREVAGFRFREGKRLWTGGGRIRRPLGARLGRSYARFGELSFALFREEAWTGVAGSVRIVWGFALARREVRIGGRVSVERIIGGYACRRRRRGGCG